MAEVVGRGKSGLFPEEGCVSSLGSGEEKKLGTSIPQLGQFGCDASYWSGAGDTLHCSMGSRMESIKAGRDGP